MTRKEMEAFEKGYVNLKIRDEEYKCDFVRDPSMIRLVDIQDDTGGAVLLTESRLLEFPTEALTLPSGWQYLENLQNANLQNQYQFDKTDYAIALLQVKPDFPDKQNFSFFDYDMACGILNGKAPSEDMYQFVHVEPVSKEFMEQHKGKGALAYRSVGEYMYAKMNNPETRPSVIDGYFGTSASVSNVVLVKERDKVTAMYIESTGFRVLDDFVQTKETGKDNQEETQMDSNYTIETLRQNVMQELANYEAGEKEADIADLMSSDMNTNCQAADRISAHYSVASYVHDIATAFDYENGESPLCESDLIILCESNAVLATAAEIYSEAGVDSRPGMLELLEMTADTISDRNKTILKNAKTLDEIDH